MVTSELLEYIKAELSRKIEQPQITQALLGVGWKLSVVEEAFKKIFGQDPEEEAQSKLPKEEKPNNTSLSGNMDLEGQPLTNFSSILSNAWRIYTHRFWTLFGIHVMPQVWQLVLGVIITLAVFSLLGSMFMSLSRAQSEGAIAGLSSIGPIAIGVVVFAMLTSVIVNHWSSAALVYAIKETPEKIGFGLSFKKGWRKVWPLFMISLLSFLVISFGLFFLIIPGIIFSLWLLFASFIAISEDLGVMQSMAKSREYIRGYGWAVFGRLFLIGLIYVGLYAAVGLVFYALFGENWAFQIITRIISVIFGPLLAVFSYLLYDQLKDRKPNLPTPDTSGFRIFIILVSIITALFFAFGTYYLVTSFKSSAQKRFDLQEMQIKGNEDLNKEMILDNGKEKIPLTPDDILGQRQT